MNTLVPSSLLLALLTSTAYAEEVVDKTANDNTAIEEMVVSAGFRKASLLDSAASVSVVDASAIAERGAVHIEQVLNLAPNVGFSSGASRARFLQMRGVGDLEQFTDPKHFASVGVTVDDVSLAGSANAAMLLDTQQVEILRGPQGTRFGTNALAGMVNITSNAPTEEFEASLEGGVGNYNRRHLGAVISGPLSSQLLGRLAVKKLVSDGFIDNDFLGRDDTNGINELAVRGKLRWLGSDSARIDFGINYFNSQNGYDAYSLNNTRTTLSDEPGRDDLEFLALSMNGLWQLNASQELNVIASVSDSDNEYAYDEDWANPTICNGVANCSGFSNTDTLAREKDAYSLDIRLLSNSNMAEAGDYQTVVGLYGQQRSENLKRDHSGRFTSDYDTDRLALYGQVEYLLSPKLQLTAGLRLERFEDDYSDLDAGGARFATDNDENLISGELTLQYFINDDNMFYATISQGNKPGGVNTEASSTFNALQAVYQDFLSSRLRIKSETLLNKELGFKGSFIDSRLSLRAAVFHMQRDNAQLESWMLDFGPTFSDFYWVGLLDSGSDAQNYGAELEADFSVNSWLSLFAAIGYLETNVDALTVYDLDQAVFVELKDRDQTKSPRYQYSFGSQLQFSPALAARIEIEGRDEQNYGYYHQQKIASYNLLHASLSYTQGDIELRVWARNLSDKDYSVHGLYFGNDPRNGYTNTAYRQLGEPRTFGVSAKYHF